MDFKKEFLKYFRYWPWFTLSLILCLGSAYFFIKLVPPTYQTSAMIFIDKKQEDKTKIITISTDQKNSEDNVEDEIRLITSNEFLSKVVKSINLNISYFENEYSVTHKPIVNVPFSIIPIVSMDSLPNISYSIKIDKKGFILTDLKTEKIYIVTGYTDSKLIKPLPFKIKMSDEAIKDPSYYFDKEYKVILEPTNIALGSLKSSLIVLADEKSKGTIQLNHIGTDPERSRKILNEIIILLDKNIVLNKQKLYVNTVSFLNQRIKDFSNEKASIETVKLVPKRVPFFCTIGGRFNCLQRASVKVKQISPRPYFAIKLICAAVANSAAMTKSPSFSRFSSSTKITILPALISAMISVIGLIDSSDIIWIFHHFLAPILSCAQHSAQFGQSLNSRGCLF